MKLKEIYANKENFKISFEVFPPKETDKYKNLYSELGNLKKYNPAFISLTWGAGGNNNNSVNLIKTFKNMGFEIMPHFTCVSSSKKFVGEHLAKLKELNIENILALRGDLPEDESQRYTDLNYANELVEYIKHNSDLSIGVAGYPEGHIEAENLEADIKNLKRKVNAGADVIFTQLFFDNNIFYKYLEKLDKENITIPIVPGIMPILSKKQIDRMTSLAKITIPNKLKNCIEKYGESNSDMQKFGVEFGYTQCEDLIKNGIKGLHFYTLNKSKSVNEILKNII